MWNCDIRARKPQATWQRAPDEFFQQSCPDQVGTAGFCTQLHPVTGYKWPREECRLVSDGLLQRRWIQKELRAGGCQLILLPRARQRFLP